MNLKAIVKKWPNRTHLSKEDIAKECQMQPVFLDFLRGLLEFDPEKRWTPLQALKHPFLTGEPFTFPYKPTPETPRVGVSKSLTEKSRTLRLPAHLHERLSLIRNAKTRLEKEGISPSVNRIAESLKISQRNVSGVFSLDREAFPSLNGLPGETLHGDEVDKLITLTLRERERGIICLYYGIDTRCLTWEDISRRIGLSRERVRQVGGSCCYGETKTCCQEEKIRGHVGKTLIWRLSI